MEAKTVLGAYESTMSGMFQHENGNKRRAGATGHFEERKKRKKRTKPRQSDVKTGEKEKGCRTSGKGVSSNVNAEKRHY